ncbi:MAG: hypothetical protein WCT10_02405 [Patescibacteria group bacterium]|jgi:hypothetical protein
MANREIEVSCVVDSMKISSRQAKGKFFKGERFFKIEERELIIDLCYRFSVTPGEALEAIARAKKANALWVVYCGNKRYYVLVS